MGAMIPISNAPIYLEIYYDFKDMSMRWKKDQWCLYN